MHEIIEDDKLKAAMERVNVVVSKHLLDEKFTLIWANDLFYQLLGYLKEEYDANFKSLSDYLIEYPDEFRKIKKIFYDTNKKTKLRYAIKMPVKSGEFIWLEMKGIISKSNQTNVVYIIYSNINDLMLEQEKLKSSYEEKIDDFEWMISEYTGNIYISDVDNYDLLYLNKHACDLLKLTLDKAIGKKCYKVIYGRNTPCPFCTNVYLKKEKVYDWEFYNPGLECAFMIKDRMIDWYGHNARIELFYIKDKSVKKVQKQQDKVLQDVYQTTQVVNADFLSSMTRNIIRSMSSIMAMTMIAQSNINSIEKVADCLNKINTSSQYLMNLINEASYISKIENGEISLILEKVDLQELVQSVYDMGLSLANNKNQEFKMVITEMKHEKILADGECLKQIFMNLISNAVKYTPSGGHILFEIKERDTQILNKGYFEFVITDDGIGMSEDLVLHLFEPFSKAEDSYISKVQGIGLGLTITEKIIRMMNGTIEVYTKLNEGSKFVISIPFQYYDETGFINKELLGQSI